MDQNLRRKYVDSTEGRCKDILRNKNGESKLARSNCFGKSNTVNADGVCDCGNICGSIICMECRISSDGKWIPDNVQNDITDANQNYNWRENTICSNVSNFIRLSIPSKTLRHHNTSMIVKEPLTMIKTIPLTHLDRSASDNYESAIELYQQENSANQILIKGHPCNKYPLSSVDVKTTNSSSISLHCNNDPSNILQDISSSTTADILCASNSKPIVSSETDCLSHLNLYMATPQFTSEQFTNVRSHEVMSDGHQKKNCVIKNFTTHLHEPSKNLKYHEKLVSSPSQGSPYSLQYKSHPSTESLQNPSLISNNCDTESNTVTRGDHSQFHTPDVPTVVLKELQKHQYGKNWEIMDSSHQILTKSSSPKLFKNLKTIKNSYDSHKNCNFHINTYNASQFPDNSFAEASITIPPESNCGSEQCCKKIGTITHELTKTNKINALYNTLPITTLPNSISHSYYDDAKNFKDCNSYNQNSISTSKLNTSYTAQTQISVKDYILESYHHSSQQYQNECHRLSEITPDIRQNKIYKCQVQTNSNSKVTCINGNNVPAFNSHIASQAKILQSSRKSHMPKPNYRELINQVYAIRNSTSEEELNLQIIKKTLNVDSQFIRSKVVPNRNEKPIFSQLEKTYQQLPTSSEDKLIVFNSLYGNTIEDVYNSELETVHVNQHLESLQKIEKVNYNIKVEDKLNSHPLDLSIRTVKTLADSTEYTYRPVPAYSKCTDCNVDYKNVLPRVDFTPNFSLRDEEPNVKNTKSLYSDLNYLGNTDKLSCNISEMDNHASTSFLKPDYTSVIHNLIKTSMDPINIVQYKTSASTFDSTHIHPATSIIETDTPTNSFLIKTKRGPQMCCDLKVCQSHGNVWESNSCIAQIMRTNSQQENTNLLSIQKFTPNRSFAFLAKPELKKDEQTDSITVQPSQSVTYKQLSNEQVNLFNRKRHLQNDRVLYSEPSTKQLRMHQKQEVLIDTKPSSDFTVVALNKCHSEVEYVETAERHMRAETLCSINNNSKLTNDCGNKSLIPKANLSLQHPIIKSETNSIIAARIRTKAELKDFIDLPLMNNSSDIKVNHNIPNLYLDRAETNQEKYLDFSWGNICNNFVEQLICSSRPNPKQNKITHTDAIPPITIIPKKENSVMIAANVEQSVHGITTDLFIITNNLAAPDSNEYKFKGNKSSSAGNSLNVGLCSSIVHDKNPAYIQSEIYSLNNSQSDQNLKKQKLGAFKKYLKKEKRKIIQKKNCSGEKHLLNYTLNSSSEEESISNLENIENKQTNKNIGNYDIDDEKYIHKATPNYVEREMNEVNSKNLEHCRRNILKGFTYETDSAEKKSTENKYCCIIKEELGKYMETKAMSSKLNINRPKQKSSSKLYTNIDLSTMTRSKRKRELELQLSNSKILRNHKMIRNSLSKIKRKYVRKLNNNKKSSNNDFNVSQTTDVMSTRLRSKKNSNSDIVKHINIYKNRSNNKKTESPSSSRTIISTNILSKKKHLDVLMEVYRYKRSLKVPPSLITIKHPNNNNTTSSLSDFQSNTKEMLKIENCSQSDIYKAVPQSTSNNSETELNRKLNPDMLLEEPRSIIDLLHSRVIKSNTYSKSNVSYKIPEVTRNNNIEPNCKNNKLLPNIRNDDTGKNNDDKKQSFSIFETKVLQSKTRTESKLQQRKENIREIFVGNDRPASAPAELIQTSEYGKILTYEHKYEQFLKEMNVEIGEDKLHTFSNTSTSIPIFNSSYVTNGITEQEHRVSNTVFSKKLLSCGDKQAKFLKISNSLKRRRPGKYVRRRGSSGFDYIRKKKKPLPAVSAQQHIQTLLKINITEDDVNRKTEEDVYREIQKWVLNKGVGQSTMHKAARQGYIDVIVYCLEHMCMKPDQKDNAGYTPLHEACTNGWLQIARVLLQFGANHSEAAHSGIRPLHEASENGHVEIVRLLLSYGADPLLATYSGQTPLMLASSTNMRGIFNNYINDLQNNEPNKKSFRFLGPWHIFDDINSGYDVLSGAPNFICDMSKARKSSVSNLIKNKKQTFHYGEIISKIVIEKCEVVLDNIDHFNSVRQYKNSEILVENYDSDGEIFEFEEADVLLPPLYLLKDEGADKWVLLSDLCNLLKVKSKDTLLNKIYQCSSVPSASKNIMRELKMSDFLEKATCLQLLYVGEKINVCASKVVLIKYNDNVRNLLGVKTIIMKL